MEVKLAHTRLDLFGAKQEIAIEASITRDSVSFPGSSNKDSRNGRLLDFVMKESARLNIAR